MRDYKSLNSKFAVGLLWGVLGLTSCHSSPTDSLNLVNHFEVHAHRGGAAQKPENSLAAFQCAVGKVGVDAIELDIHQTLDRVLIVNHDPTINPKICLSPKGKTIQKPAVISEMTYAEVRKFDCGTLVGLPAKTSLPTLDEVFELVEKTTPVSGNQVNYDIHVKWDPKTIPASEYAQLIMNSVVKFGLLSRVTFMNDFPEFLFAARKLEVSLNLYYLVAEVTQTILDDATKARVNALVMYGPLVNQTLVGEIHKSGFQIIPFGANNSIYWDSLIKLGVDGILTDDPLGLKQFLNTHSLSPNVNSGTIGS